jgi:dihydroorotase
MHLLIKSAKLFNEGSAHHLQVVDIEVKAGVIQRIGTALSSLGATEITGKELWVSAGFVDTYAFFRDPGFEYKEDLASGCEAAFRGGFTHVLLQPDTFPYIQTKGEVQAMLSKAANAPIQVLVAGALTENLEGKDITEMLDMHRAGAICFSNGDKAVADTSAQMRALQYAQHVNALVMSYPNDAYLSKSGQVHEGIVSTQLGLKGIPALAEEMQIARDLALLSYTGGRLHFSKISSARSVQLIREAKAAGMQVSCGVSAHHLLLNHEVLPGFDTNYKVMPPLRTETDRLALLKAVEEGVIDVVCSDHQPEDVEHKFLEFDLAKPGIAGIETAFSVVASACSPKELAAVLPALNQRPAQLLGLPAVSFEAGAPADLVVFDVAETYTVEKANLRTKGINNPFIGQNLKAPICLVVRGHHHYISHA